MGAVVETFSASIFQADYPALGLGDDGSYALSFWIYNPSTTPTNYIGALNITLPNEVGGETRLVRLEDDGTVYFYGFTGPSGPIVEFNSSNTAVDGWNHIALVGSGTNLRYIYLNGVQTTNTEFEPNINGQSIYLYSGQTGATRKAAFAELTYWSSGITPEHVAMLVNGITSTQINTRNIQSYFPLYTHNGPDLFGGATLTNPATSGSQTHPPVAKMGRAYYPRVDNWADIPLFTQGHLPYSSGDGSFDSGFSWSFYNQLQGIPPGWHMSLYLDADYTVHSGDMTLYTQAYKSINNLDGAYDDSYDYDFDIANPLPLFLQVVNQLPEPTGVDDDIFGLNLFIKGFSTARNTSGNVPFSTFGFDGTGILNSADLFIEGFASTQITKNATLYLKAVPSGQSSINLFLNAGIDKETNTVPLYLQVLSMESGLNFPLTIWNPTTTASGGPFNLFTYSTEGTGVYNSFEMVTLGHSEFQGSSFNLYAHAIGSGSSNINLYLHGEEVDELNSSINLFINNELRPNNYVPMTVFNGQGVMSGDLTLFLANEYGDTNENVTLFLGADGPFGQSGTINLYMHRSSESLSFNLPLFVDGSGIGDLTGSIDLYTSGNTSTFSTTTLYTLGFTDDSTTMPLFLSGRTYPSDSGFTPLFTWGADESGIYNFTTLFTAGPDPTGYQNTNIRLFLKQESSVTETSQINLFAKSYGNTDGSVTHTGEVLLTMYNNAEQASGLLTLFMNGPSGTEPFIPHSSTMNLVMWREIESSALSLPFFIGGPEGVNSGVPFFLEAQPRPTGVITLFLDGGVSGVNELVKLYTHGF